MTAATTAMYTAGAAIILLSLAFMFASPARSEPPIKRPDAQQVYIMYPDTWRGRWFGPSKIGISNKPERRRKTFATGHFDEIVIYQSFVVRNASDVESAAHDYLAPLHRRGEWFNVSPAAAARAVRIVSQQTEAGIGHAFRRWMLKWKIARAK